jgi:Spy/CpxP family protein refolding chaperone
MTISSLIGSRLLSGIAAFALTGSLVGGTAVAAEPDNSIREIRHDVRDQSKAQREEIKQLRAEFAAEYAKERPDAEKLEALNAAIETKRAEIRAMRFSALMKMHDELDAAQRERMAERMTHEGKHRGHDGEHGKAKAKGKGKDKANDDVEADRDDETAERGKGKGKDKDKPEDHGKGKDKGKDNDAKGKAKGKSKDKPEPAPV